MIRIFRAKDYDAMSKKAAAVMAAQVLQEPNCVLGLATGTTPIGMYEQLAAWNAAGELDFSGVHTVNLDEYKGLPGTHAQSYRYFMNLHLFDHINIDKANTNVPNGMAEDAAAECRRYDEMIAALGGIDLQLLGIGHNGHIGFNEPADTFVKETHVVDLTESTINANARLFASRDEVPIQAMTMGIRAIMQAKKILLVVNGAGKAQILRDALFGPVTPHNQASIVQLHPDVVVIGDEAALSACEFEGESLSML